MGRFFSFALCCCLLTSFPAAARGKKKSASHPAVLLRLDPQTLRELMGNPDLQNCYLNSPAGQRKQKGQIHILFNIDLRGKVSQYIYDPKQSTLPESTGRCVIGVLKTLIIPFSSKARGHQSSALFRWP